MMEVPIEKLGKPIPTLNITTYKLPNKKFKNNFCITGRLSLMLKIQYNDQIKLLPTAKTTPKILDELSELQFPLEINKTPKNETISAKNETHESF